MRKTEKYKKHSRYSGDIEVKHEVKTKTGKRIGKGKRKGLLMVSLMLLLLSVVFYGKPEEESVAAVQDTIVSREDYFNKLEMQIFNREVSHNYRVPDRTLGMDILNNMDMEGFQSNYHEDRPLLSGCYLSYYTKRVYMTYGSGTLQIRIELPYMKDEMDAHFEKMKKLAVELKGNSDYETVKNVHDYLIDHFEYDHRTSFENHTDIDGFRDGKMVCSGYSLAAYYLLNEAGVKTRVVTGSGNEELSDTMDHMWNVVLVDGKWYNLDITWDDGGGDKKLDTYFLKSDADFPNHRRLGYYAGPSFGVQIADESYPLPKKIDSKNIMLGVLIAAMFITVFVFVRYDTNKKKKEEEANALYRDTPWDDTWQ